MPVAVLSEEIPLKITRPEHLVEYFAEYLALNIPELEYIAKYDENLIPKYPAVQIMAGAVDKTVHGLHTFNISLRAIFYVLHAKASENKTSRSLHDLQLATKIVELLEADLSLGKRVITGVVETEAPTALPPRTKKGDIVVSTRLTWVGLIQTRFK